MIYSYPANIDRDGDGYMVTFDGLPGGTCGDTEDEALARAEELLVTALASFVEEGLPLPPRTRPDGRRVVAVPALDAAKLALHEAMLEAKMSNVALARRMGLDEKDVRRLRDPLHRGHIGRVEAALRVLGKRLEVKVA